MVLDLIPFEKAIAQLEKSLGYACSPLAQSDSDLFIQFRVAAIKAFEFTYELSIKMIKRFMEATKPDVEVDAYTFRDLMREAREYGVIDGINPWIEYRDKRNITSHTYNNDAAAEVYAVLPRFLADAKNVHDRIKKRQEPPS